MQCHMANYKQYKGYRKAAYSVQSYLMAGEETRAIKVSMDTHRDTVLVNK